MEGASLAAIKKQLELLKLEREQDYKQYQQKMLQSSLADREKEGLTWYPVKLVQDFISTGERISLVLEKTKNLSQKHLFQVGAVVGVFTGTDEKGKSVPGVVGYLKEHTMRVVLNQSSLPDWLYEERIGINLLFDDASYRDMEQALKDVMGAERNRLADLRKVFYGEKLASIKKGYEYQLPTLNDRQNAAFQHIVDAEDMALVHGPPGTGKTTTLVTCIKDIVKREHQVLVCAPSNAAVDLLVEKLAERELNVLRLGHPARLTPSVIENSLDVKISKHREFDRLKSLRKRSEEFRAMAKKYKRNFGREERMQRNMLFSEARALKEESKQIEQYITESLLDEAHVIACTLTGSNHPMIKDRMFKTVFIDESSQALEAACWIPLNRAQKVVMSGDHHQLPPTIKSHEAAKSGLEETLFYKGIFNQPQTSVMLETQYRMHPAIMSFSSQYFYGNGLTPSESVTNRQALFEEAIVFIDTAGAGYEEKVKNETLSTYNEDEAAFLVKFIEQEVLPDLSVGIIAPYKAQNECLERLVNESDTLAQVRDQISINTVDAFQGQERDVMYISLTRSNEKGGIGFLKEYRRMNVAMTRARHHLVMIGDSATLGNDPFYEQVLTYCQTKGRYLSVFEYMYLLD